MDLLSLEVRDDQGRINVFRPGSTAFRVGRAPDNDLVLDRAGVSRAHLQIYWSDDGMWKGANLSATSGTILNHKPFRQGGLAGAHGLRRSCLHNLCQLLPSPQK